MRNRRGEITTILMLGTLVVIGVTAVISSFTVKDKKTTSSRAAEANCTNVSQSYCNNLIKYGDCPSGNLGTQCLKCTNGKYRCPGTKDDSLVSPTPASCTSKSCTTGTGEPYWVRSGKNYSDDKCNEVITKLIGDWCKGSGLIPIPSKTPVPSTTNTKTYCSGTTGTYYYKCTYGNYVDSTCNKEKIPDVNKWCIPTILTSPTPSQDNCTKGQYFVGTGGYNMETPEQICDANNGVYVGSSQQGKVGEQRWACCSVSNSSPNATCPKPGLGYACCVVDSRCDNDTNRYRWYGCTGQVCSATIISTKGGPGHLVDCPYGVNKQNQESCESALTPPKLPSVNCTDYGSYGLLGGCREKCGAGYECKSAEGDASGEKRFCCPPPPPPPEIPPKVVIPPATDNCEKKFANCLEAYKPKYQGENKFSYYKSKSGTGANIYSSGDANNCTQSTWNEIANHYCKDTPLSEVSPVPGGNNPPDPEASPEPEVPQNLVPEKVDINELGSTQCEVKLPGGGNKIYSCDSSNTVRQEEKCTNGKWDGVKQATTVCAQWYAFARKKCFFYYLTTLNGQVNRSQASYDSIDAALNASPCNIAQGQTDSFSVEIRIPKEKNIQEANICLKDGGDYQCKSVSQTGTEDGHTMVYTTQYTLGTATYNRLLKVYVIDANGNTYYGIPVEKTLLINSMDQTPDYSFSINWN